MIKVKLTNDTTSKNTTRELDLDATLSVVRKQLGAFMKKDDVFLGTGGEPVASALEATTRLKAIQSSANGAAPSIKLAKKAEAEPKPETAADVAEGPVDESPEGIDGGPETRDDGGTDVTPDPLNIEPFKEGSLQPVELPEYEWAPDYVGLETGLLPDGKPVRGDRLSQMKVGQVRKLLKANRIDLNKNRRGITAAFVDTGDLVRARYDAVHCTEVELKEPDATRITNISFQYDEHVARLHRTATNEGDADVGVPGIFNVRGSYRYATASRSDTRVVKKHMSASHILPKARVVFKDDKITLSDEFVARIRQAVEGGEGRISAEKLLDVLEAYGQFFASDMLLGGRLIHWTSTELRDSHHATETQNEFRVAARARASIDGVQGEAGGSWGYGLSDQEKAIAINQAHSLHFKLMGGNEATATSETWIPTVAKYLNWKVIGFNSNSLVPTIDYLPNDLRLLCMKLLKTYFTSNLQFRTTELVGLTHEGTFGYDAGDVKRIVKIEMNHGINIDGLRVTYELMNGQRKEMPWVGGRRGEHNSTIGPFDFDEEITSIEVGAKTLLRRIAFNTSKRRFPESTSSYYGRGQDGEVLTYTTIEAPRVCGLVGHVGGIIDAIGLRYRDLPADRVVRSRHFLLDIEPHLFPINVPSTIELTVRGVLLAGKWRTEQDLNRTSADNKRNTLITELGAHSNETDGYMQGLNDQVLVGKAALLLLLMDASIRDKAWLKANRFDNHRNALIESIHSFTNEPVGALQGLSDEELVRWGSTIKSNSAAALAARV